MDDENKEEEFKCNFWSLKSTICRENVSGLIYSRFLLIKQITFPAVNFTNILQAAFLPIFYGQKITKANCK